MPSGTYSKRPRSAIVVELFGLPGSGKTFLTQALAQLLREKGRSVLDFSRGTSPSRLTWRWAMDHLARQAWMLRHPLSTLSLRRQVSMSGQTNRDECKRFIQGWLKTVVRLGHAKSSYDIILMDQGFLQTLWAIGYRANPSAWPPIRRHLLRLMPVPNAVILVEASPHTAAKRLTARPGSASRLEQDGPHHTSVMQHAQQLTDQIKQALSSDVSSWTNTRILTFNNDRDNDHNPSLQEIVAKLKHLN